MSEPSPAASAVTTSIDDARVLRIDLDDGKANVFSPTTIAALGEALDRAEAEASAVLLVGRPGRFSAGFDLSVMQSGPAAARDLVRSGAELALRLFELPVPVVMACTGHALAMGVITLLAGDLRIGARGDFKLGLNEVSIGMPVPFFAAELARVRLTPRYFTRAVGQAEIYTPDEALEAGYLDEVVEPGDLDAAATDHARRLVDHLDPVAFRLTRRTTRRATAELIRGSLDTDLADFQITT